VKAIIITDSDSMALLDRLELVALRNAGHYRGMDQPAPTPEQIAHAHRVFHYVVTRWLQEMGAETVRR
jgi:hypothetical protein